MSNNAQFRSADSIARALAKEVCLQPQNMSDEGEPSIMVNCSEVLVCGGRCLPCCAKIYVESYPK